MNDVNDTMLSKNAELAHELFAISKLADLGHNASFPVNSDTKIDPDAVGTLFQVIKEKLNVLEKVVLQQSDVKDNSTPSPKKSVTAQTPINREFENNVIRQRGDGYIDATAMCQATGKRIDNYWRLDSTQTFLNALSEKTGMSIKSDSSQFPQKSVIQQNQSLIESKIGGIEAGGGTWIHPHVAINLAQWCSPAFAVQVTDWVFELMTKGEVHLQSKPQLSKIHDLFPRTDAPVQAYIDECLERREAGEEIPQLNSRELVRKAIREGYHTRREIADYTGIKVDTVKKIVYRMMKKGLLSCTTVKGHSRLFLN